jgi:hypothetical protein
VTNPGNIEIADRHMNVEIGTESTQFADKEYINGIFFAVCIAISGNAMAGKMKPVNANIYCNYIWNTLFQMLKKVENRSFQSFGFVSRSERWTLWRKHLCTHRKETSNNNKKRRHMTMEGVHFVYCWGRIFTFSFHGKGNGHAY